MRVGGGLPRHRSRRRSRCRRGPGRRRRRLLGGEPRPALLQRVDEVEQLALGLRRVGRHGHQARRLRERLRAALPSWRRTAASRIPRAQALERAAETEAPAIALGLGRQQLLAPLRHRLRTLADFEPQRFVDRRQERRPVGAERNGPGRHVLVVDHARGRIRRTLARHRVVERGTQRVDIRPRPLLARRGGVLLVGAVARLDERAHRLGMGGDLAARRAEVDQHRRPVLADDDVVGGDVAVQKGAAVHHLQRVEQGVEDLVELVLARRALQALQPGLEAAPLLEVEHHVAGVVGPEVAIDAHDVGVDEAGERLRLLDEALEAPFVVFGAILRARRGIGWWSGARRSRPGSTP